MNLFFCLEEKDDLSIDRTHLCNLRLRLKHDNGTRDKLHIDESKNIDSSTKNRRIVDRSSFDRPSMIAADGKILLYILIGRIILLLISYLCCLSPPALWLLCLVCLGCCLRVFSYFCRSSCARRVFRFSVFLLRGPRWPGRPDGEEDD